MDRNEAIKIVKSHYPANKQMLNEALEFLIPELKESEDERIRKEFISFLKSPFVNEYIADERVTPWIAWLEKQQKSGDNVEPKFKVKYAGSEYNVLEVKDIAGVTYYGIEDEPNHIDYVFPDNCEIVSEQKPADSYCQENCKGFQETGKCFADGDCKAKREAEQKPAWSEEDNKHLERILKELENQRQRPSNRPYLEEIASDYNWLKSLKDRVQPKQEWSEEDSMHLTNAILAAEKEWGNESCTSKWLKSLRLQKQWKPSDEQMRELSNVAKGKGWFSKEILSELLEQLKKLREE